jgi:hypothetical protein
MRVLSASVQLFGVLGEIAAYCDGIITAKTQKGMARIRSLQDNNILVHPFGRNPLVESVTPAIWLAYFALFAVSAVNRR